jgi:23S rRNA pseudouridine1911/1915/1917 synthase
MLIFLINFALTMAIPNQKDNTILAVTENTTLMPFLLHQLKHKSRDNVKSLLRNKQVWVNGQAISQFNHPLLPGQQVAVKWDLAAAGNLYHGLRIVFEDEYIVVIDKEAGLLSISTGNTDVTAYSIIGGHVKRLNPKNKIFVVHRLDRDTSGLMMFAKNEKVQSLMQKAWQTSVSERTYTALVEGKLDKPEGTISSYLYESKSLVMHSSLDPGKGELAITHYKTLKSGNNFSLLEVYLETGKKNQIRVHMKDIGHSVTGDKKYGAIKDPLGRLGLHAGVLAFIHPVTREPLRFESTVPTKFLRLF